MTTMCPVVAIARVRRAATALGPRTTTTVGFCSDARSGCPPRSRTQPRPPRSSRGPKIHSSSHVEFETSSQSQMRARTPAIVVAPCPPETPTTSTVLRSWIMTILYLIGDAIGRTLIPALVASPRRQIHPQQVNQLLTVRPLLEPLEEFLLAGLAEHHAVDGE